VAGRTFAGASNFGRMVRFPACMKREQGTPALLYSSPPLPLKDGGQPDANGHDLVRVEHRSVFAAREPRKMLPRRILITERHRRPELTLFVQNAEKSVIVGGTIARRRDGFGVSHGSTTTKRLRAISFARSAAPVRPLLLIV